MAFLIAEDGEINGSDPWSLFCVVFAFVERKGSWLLPVEWRGALKAPPRLGFHLDDEADFD